MRFEVFGDTDIGKKREINEDNYLCLPLKQGSHQVFFLAVVDGMGGHAEGETASRVAIDILKKNIMHRLQIYKGEPHSIVSVMEDSIQSANQEIFLRASQDQQLAGMATTLVAALLLEKKATIAGIGDSRAYLIRKKSITQITKDHIWKNEQLDARSLSQEEIENSPFKNMVTRALGLKSQAVIDTFEVEIKPKDRLLLCTDGLYNLVPEMEILKIIRKHKSLKEIAQKLIDAANERGGHDNITVILAQAKMKGKDESPLTSFSDTAKLAFGKKWKP